MHDAYLWVKFLHVLGAVLFTAWVLLAPLWFVVALRHTAAEGVGRTRRAFTVLTVTCIAGGGLVITATGMLMARVLSPDAFDLHWMRASLIAFTAAATLWLIVLLPLHRHLLDARATGRLVMAATLAAVLAAALTVFALWMMVVKPL